MRAAELAMIRQVSLAKALETTEHVAPERPEWNQAAMENPLTTAAAMDQRKAQIQQAIQQTRSMLFLSNSMVTMALNQQAGGQMGISVAAGQGAMQYQQMAAAALEDSSSKAKDISGLMRMAPGEFQGAGEGELAPALPGGGGRGAGEQTPPPLPKEIKAMPGRKVMAGGTATDWMYVDSWYLIGPFPNPQRVNIETKFPPDSVIDLDAEYDVGNGRVARWEFYKSPSHHVVPPRDEEYVIYYAYTELWLDQARDLWIAVGSDDNSRIWINDKPVWISEYRLKIWRVNEGLRRVHFQQGRNRILYRVENGHKGSGFSMLIATGVAKSPPF